MSSLEKLYQAVVVTAEVIGHEISPAAAREMARELLSYPEATVAAALNRCKRELSGRLTLAAILQRIDDGHLGVEEAWALVPRNEDDTVVWTDEIADAYQVCRSLLESDHVAARMAFKESYLRALAVARAESKPARWWVSPGHDQSGRVSAVKQALDAGRITAGEAQHHVHDGMPGYHAIAASLGKALPTGAPTPLALPRSDETAPLADDVQALLENLRAKAGV